MADGACVWVMQMDTGSSFSRMDSGPASPSGRGPDKPVKVQAHSKLVKELTHLCVIQELNAHNGAATACAIISALFTIVLGGP